MKQYDFAINWSGNVKEKFVDFIKTACKQSQLSFFWICDDNAKDVTRELENNQIAIKVLLDTEATYNKKSDFYARICYAVKDSGGIVINDPDRAKVAVDKSITHYELMNIGIVLPYTVVVRNWEPNNFKLTEEERNSLGVPFVIKPALGYGRGGVIQDARGSIREIATARNFDRGDNFLLQEKITPIELGNRRAWFRVFNVFGTIIPCWWDDQNYIYKHVGYEEFNNYRLFSLAKIVSKIAAVTRMSWFSTEITIDNKTGKMRFIAIDYVNDQCDMTTQSEAEDGAPDAIVEYTASYIVNAASQLINNEKLSKKYTIWLEDASIEIRGLGISPDVLTQATSKILSPQDKSETVS